MAAVFAFDLSTRLGVAAGVPYVLAVLVALRLPDRRLVIAVTAASVLLVAGGYLLSPARGPAWVALTNRGLAVLALAMTAVLGLRLRDTADRLAAARGQIELQRLEDLLAAEQTALEASTGQLSAAQRRLATTKRDLDELAYVASHDLKSPLRDVDNLARWIYEDAAELLTGETREWLTLLRQRVQRMERLLDDLLVYSRAGRLVGAIRSFDSAEVVREAVDRAQIPDSFAVELPEQSYAMYGPPAPLVQALAALLSNAALHHDRADGTIAVGVFEQGDSVGFEVRDDGPGIPETLHEKVFMMFQTLKPRDELDRSGVGLALVRKLAAAAGGAVALESATGRGCNVRLVWPRDWNPEGSA
jgi:signal transduction histidine kinase